MTASEETLEVGLVLPLEETHMGGGTARWDDLVEMAVEAESVGFDSVWVSDHLMLHNEGEPIHGAWECWSLAAALAGRTTTIRIGTQVTSASFRHPGLLARIVDTVDEISGGRLIVGIGAGDHEPEYVSLGLPFRDRVGRAEDYLTAFTELLRAGRSDHQGPHFQLSNFEMPLRGPRLGGIPIVIAAEGPRMLRVAARYADGWMTFDKSREQQTGLEARFVDACKLEGRTSTSIGRVRAGVVIRFSDQASVPWASAPALTGTPSEIAESLQAMHAEGASTVLTWPDPNSITGIRAMRPVLEYLHAVGTTT